MYRIDLKTAFRIAKTNKEFILFDLDSNNNIINYRLTNNLERWHNHFSKMMLTDIFKKETNSILFNYN